MVGPLRMVAELVELLGHSSKLVVADSLPVECMTFVVEADRTVAEQSVAENIVPDTAVSSSIASTELSAEWALLPVQRIHSMRSTALDTGQTELPSDSEWLFEWIQSVAIWVRVLHIHFEFAVAFVGQHNLSMAAVDGQDLVGFEFVLGFAAFATLAQRPAEAFAVRGDVVELTDFVRLRWCVDAASSNVLPIEIRFPSYSRFAIVAAAAVASVVAVVVAMISVAECSSMAVERASDWRWVMLTVEFDLSSLTTTIPAGVQLLAVQDDPFR